MRTTLLRSIRGFISLLCLVSALGAAAVPAWAAQVGGADPEDVLVLKNGDTLHGKLVKEVDGTVTFHTDALGDVAVKWANVKELHTDQSFGVLNSQVKLRGKKNVGEIPVGPLDVQGQEISVHPVTGAALATRIPAGDAAYIVDQKTLNRQVFHQPSLLSGWNGAATVGVTLVQATQNQYTESGSVGMVRVVPAVPWMNPRNRTSADLSGSFGKITQPGTTTVKTEIFHADAERDQYFSPRFFGLAQVAFDHNFAQGLSLQSIYGGGIGFTALKTTRQELDVKATLQFESQQFLAFPPAPADPTQHLVGSTFAANYTREWGLFTLVQGVAFVPAYNNPHAYSANETNSLTFPAYKNLGFSVGTLDSYVNNLPTSTPPTKRNSFQFTMGLTYAIRSKY